MSLRLPQSYLKGIRQEIFSNERLWIYIAHAIWQSLVCYFIVHLIISDNTFTNGYPYEASAFSTLISFAAIFIINLFGSSNWFSWTWINVFSFTLSMTLWIAYLLLYSSQKESATYGQLSILFTSPVFYAIFVILTVVSLLPRLTIKFTQQFFYPNDTDLIREMQKRAKRVSIEFDTSNSSAVNNSNHGDRFSFMSSRSSFGYTQPLHLTDGFEPDKASDLPAGTIPPDSRSNSPEIGKKTSTLTAMRQENLHNRTTSFTKAFEFMKNKLLNGLEHSRPLPSTRRGSIIYMSTPDRIGVPNTGFAFSQEAGMEEIICSPRVSASERKNVPKQSILPGSTLRNISINIASMLRFSRPSTPVNNLDLNSFVAQKLSPQTEVEEVESKP